MRRISAIGVTTVLLLPLVTAEAYPQTKRYSGHRFPTPGSYSSKVTPPDAMDLVPLRGERRGKVWVEHWNDGIAIMGVVEGERPDWARFPLEMDARAHVCLWLAVADRVEMPEIGWGNQVGYTNCKDFDATSHRGGEDCEVWRRRQEAYRELLKQLFVRRWRLAPGASEETLATKAYQAVLGYA